MFDGLIQLAEKNYNELHPQRPNAKQLAFKWLGEQRYTDILDSRQPKEAAYEHIKRLVESLTRLKKLLEDNYPEGSPFPSNILKAAQKWERSTKPKPKTEPAPAATAPSGQTTAAQSSAEAPAAQAGAPIKLENTKDAQAECKKIAMFLIEKEPEKPLGYRLLRSLRWDIIDKAPLAESGKTKIEALPAERKTYIQTLLSKGDWKQTLLTAEKTFSSGPTQYWLDLQRISAIACKNLGNTYEAAYNAICFETAFFLKRIPAILDLSYSDGSPFCDSITKEWLESEVSAATAPGKHSSGASSVQDDPIAGEKKEINDLASSGKIEAAIEILQKKINQSGYERANFKRSILLCNLLISASHAEIAVSILESLNEKIDRYNLHKWEPELAVETWRLLLKTYGTLSSSQTQNKQVAIQEKQNSILNKISCIDPITALKIKI